MTTTNNEIDCIVAEVSTILRNRLNTLVNNVKNDETNEAVLNLPIVKKVLDSVKGQSINNTTSNNDDEIRQLQKESQSCKEDIKTLTNMCLQISKAISDLQSSIGNLSDKQNNLTKYVEQTKEAENIQIKIVEKEKPKPNIIFIEEEDEEEDNSNNTFEIKEQEEVASEEEVVEEQVASETEEQVEEQEASEAEQEQVEEEEEAEVSEAEEQVEEQASEAEEVEEQEEVTSEADEVVEEQEEAVEEEVASKAEEEEEEVEEEEGGLEVFEIEIDDVTYFATDEENGDLYEVDKDGDIGKKVGFIKDGEVEFI
jgi:chromosome segregation ATPase